ncbi:response regulator [Propionivibrio dicarboxylicus]|uniref:Putative two-component system response regulator n=1 Tax=Propionivibrio dicarboxylicus TaxID=83767 RepID=A0A1G8ADR8_9RHOO|nr:HD domain-containing phosphohydrolase [Propionivibrio dicarboxylicus]SDH19023.1 putative two-component system response regulator [Propionivibrio dicarboxylicus]
MLQKQTILIVDDTPQNLTVLGELLREQYQVRVANSGERALRAAHGEPRPDLILLDVMMPEMDGHEVCRRLGADVDTCDIPVIFITAMSSAEDERHGLDLGAVDYITKPFSPPIVLARVRTQLELKAARDRLSQQNDWLESEIARRMSENLLIQELNIHALACLAEARDNETGLHIVRTQAYVDILARHLAEHRRFRAALEGNRLAMIVKAAPLHDIGKVGIPDSILLKPGRLTPEEFKVMQTHPEIGAAAIDKAIDQSRAAVDVSVAQQHVGAFDFLYLAAEISLSHHEKWDGSGYPAAKSGDDIPVSGRLMALADVFDALMSHRVYKAAMSLEETTRIIVEGRARHFDPDVVDAFLACRDAFATIAERFADPASVPA